LHSKYIRKWNYFSLNLPRKIGFLVSAERGGTEKIIKDQLEKEKEKAELMIRAIGDAIKEAIERQ